MKTNGHSIGGDRVQLTGCRMMHRGYFPDKPNFWTQWTGRLSRAIFSPLPFTSYLHSPAASTSSSRTRINDSDKAGKHMRIDGLNGTARMLPQQRPRRTKHHKIYICIYQIASGRCDKKNLPVFPAGTGHTVRQYQRSTTLGWNFAKQILLHVLGTLGTTRCPCISDLSRLRTCSGHGVHQKILYLPG